MTSEKPRIRVLLIVQDYEMKLASDILLLRYFFQKELNGFADVVIVDNGSTDRTHEIARNLKVEVFRTREKRTKQEIVKKALRIGEAKDISTLLILDVQGGNTADDAISLIARSIEEGSRFASAYIRPEKERAGIGCWAIDKGILDKIGEGPGSDIQKKMIELASKDDLELWAISEEVSFTSKKTRKKFFKLFKGSPLDALTGLIRYHPLTFYGGVGLIILSLAIVSGFYTVDYFYEHKDLNYFPAFTTMALIMIGGFFMVAGLILNTYNVLVERIEAMSKWNE